MESRKLKRYDSAPISTGTSAATAARAVAHVSNIPRPGALPSSNASSKPTIKITSSSSAAAAAAAVSATTPAEPYEKQLEAYYRCMEEDNQALLTYYETHTMDIAALKVLVQERKYKDTIFRSMEMKTAAMERFVQEMADLLAPNRGCLRSRGDANAQTAVGSAAVKSNSSSDNNSKTSPDSAAPAASMDSVRDAVQKLQAAHQAACAREEKHKLTIQALEKEVVEWKEKMRSHLAQTRPGAPKDNSSSYAEEDSYFLPGTAKALRDAQRRVRTLERQLADTTAEQKDAATTLALVEEQQRVTTQTLQRREAELTAMRGLLNSKEQLLAALEEEAKTARASSTSLSLNASGNARYIRTNSAPVKAGTSGSPHHRFGGEVNGDRLVVTHHYRLLSGPRFVEGQAFSAESFKDAFVRSVALLLHVPCSYLTNIEVRAHTEAVSVEMDIRHASRIKEDEIDFLLLSHDYPEVAAYLDKVKTELAAMATTPIDRNAIRVEELQTVVTEKEQELRYLRRKLRALEASVERRDTDREVLDKDVDAALQETENTVKGLYEALQAAQQETEAAQKALSLKASQVRVLEQAKNVAVDAAAAAERSYKEEIANLNEQLVQAQTDLKQAKDSVMEATLKVQAEETIDVYRAVFTFDIPLSTSSAHRTAAALLKDAQQVRLLHALVLAHAGRTGGAVPVQVRSCAVSEKNGGKSSSPLALQVAVELAYYANKRTCDTAKMEVERKLNDGGNCTNYVQDYLRMRGEAARKETAAAVDAQRAVTEAEQRATATIAAMRAETQRAHETKLEAAVSQLQEIAARVSSVIPASPQAGADSPNTTNSSVASRVDQLITRLATAEAAVHRQEEENQRAARRLAEVQQERDQLQQTLSEFTARCTEMQLAKERLASRLATTEDQLKSVQATAAESERAMTYKASQLELTLRATKAAAEEERKKSTEELRTAMTVSAGRLTEAEEALAKKELEMKRLQTRLSATSTAAAAPKGLPKEESALREALRVAKEDSTALARQVKEMETDMNDLSNIQAAMQRELESTQQELRAKRHDFDLLVKQLIRMEEKEKKWQANQRSEVASPVSSSHLQEEEAEKDDVVRESLVVLTNSNTNLQQWLRRLQHTTNMMGLEVKTASGSGKMSRGSANSTTSATDDVNGSNYGARRSGHRKGALSATVSRAAMDHQQLSAQLSHLLLSMLEEFEKGLSSSGSSNINTTADGGGVGGGRTVGSGAAFSRTASGNGSIPHHGAPACKVKQHLSNSPFARTRSTPSMGERVSHCTDSNDAAATAGASPHTTPMKESYGPGSNNPAPAAAAVYASPTVTGSGGKVTVDAAPRLDFYRQASSHTYMRSNTTAAALSSTPNNSGKGGGLPPTSGSASNGGCGEAEKDRRDREVPQCCTGSGSDGGTATATTMNTSAGTSGAIVPQSHNTSVSGTTATTTAKSNPFRRSNTAKASTTSTSTGNANFMRVKSNSRRTVTNTITETGRASSSSSSQAHMRYRMRF